jgi:predicted GH43/DUF377 family glycosyl hydrolase
MDETKYRYNDMKKRTVIIGLVLLAFVIVNISATSAGWLTGYDYRKQINITGQSGAGTNYQIKIPVYYMDFLPDVTDLISQTQVWTGNETWTDEEKELATDIIEGLGQLQWKREATNPVLDLGESDEWDDGGIQNPKVTYFDNTWRMYYTGFKDGGSSQSDWQIGLATSDDGITWSRYDSNPIIPKGGVGEWDENMVASAGVIKDGDTYKMWYHGRDAADKHRIGLATSTDGTNWTKYDSNPVMEPSVSGWDSAHIYSARVIKEGETYKMWYTGQSLTSKPQIGYATSPDGITWTKYEGNPVIPYSSDYQRWNRALNELLDTLKIGDKYVLFCEGTKEFPYEAYRIGMFYSSDGINWTEHSNNPVFTFNAAGEWDDYHALHPNLVWDPVEKTFYLYYIGTNGQSFDNVAKVGLAGLIMDGVIVEEHCQIDFDDIRFTDSTGENKLSYWLEGVDEGKRAIAWVKVEDSLETDKDIYIYYGNLTAVSESSGESVFEFFDDFDDESLDAAKWTAVSTSQGVTVTETGGYLNIGGTSSASNANANANTNGKYTLPATYILEGSVNSLPVIDANWDSGMTVWHDSNNRIHFYPSWWTPVDALCRWWQLDGGVENSATLALDRLENYYHVYRYVYKGDGSFDLYMDNIFRATKTNNGAGSDAYILLFGYEGLSGKLANTRFDDIRARKYVAIEPTISRVGEEETEEGPSPTPTPTPSPHEPVIDDLIYPKNGSTITELTTCLLVSVSDPDKDVLTVRFYKSDHTLIGTSTVHGSGEAGCVYKGLTHGNTYNWYCAVTDGTTPVQSDTWHFTSDVAAASAEEEDVYIDPDSGEGWTDIGNTTAIFTMVLKPFIATMGSWFYVIFIMTTVGMAYLKTQRVFLPASMLLVFGILMSALLPEEMYPVAYGMIALGFSGIVYIIFTRKQ